MAAFMVDLPDRAAMWLRGSFSIVPRARYNAAQSVQCLARTGSWELRRADA
jgi:hypothetical protein